MKYKFFNLIVLFTTFLSLLIIALFNFYYDPFYYYHKPYTNVKAVSYGAINQNLNIARNFEYDSVLVGTSMSENFRKSWFDQKYGLNLSKLSFAGSFTSDMEKLFNNVYKSKNDVKKVFWCIDLNTLSAKENYSNYNFNNYQISNNFIDDFEYLLNKEILLNYSMKTRTLSKLDSYHYDEENLYVWDDVSIFGKDITLKNYQRPEIYQGISKTQDQIDNYYKNIEIIKKIIKEYPTTDFYFIFTPYSILYWDSSIRKGTYQGDIKILELAVEELQNYENVKVFNFLDAYDIITNLDNYKDYIHYKKEVNKFMFDNLEKEDYLVKRNNMEKSIKSFNAYILNYDYDSIFRD